MGRDNLGLSVSDTFDPQISVARVSIIRPCLVETGDQKILISAEQRLGGWRRLRHQAGHQEGDPVAPEGQAFLQVEGALLHPDQGLLPLLQEGLLKALRDGRIPVQGE